MDYLLVCSVAIFASALTLVTGFGLGTLLMPAFAIFFPLPAAIAATAVVHLANNLFALGLIGRYADRRVVLRFGVPAAIAAFAGAAMLGALSGFRPIAVWHAGSHVFEVTIVKVAVAILIIGFALLDLLPILSRLRIGPNLLPLGGALSGFFGGLSGHQGTLRSAFLIRLGLSKETYIGVNNVCGVMVDVARLLVYGIAFLGASGVADGAIRIPLVAAACLAAFFGAFVGTRLMKKITIEALRLVVAVLLIASGVALGTGLI